MTRVALLFPPATEPRNPRLPLPALAAYLRQRGVDVRLIDMDIESLLAMLRPASLRAAGERIRSGVSRGGSSAPERRRLETLAERLPSEIGDALAVMWSYERFLSANERATAYARIQDGLDLVSTAARRPVRYSLKQAHYEVQGVDGSRYEQVLSAADDPDANLFHDFWKRELLPRLVGLDLVGISIMGRRQFVPAMMLARMLKAEGHFVVLGGTFIARFVEAIAGLPQFFQDFADGVVVYEGETALIELLDQLEGRRDFRRVPNYMYCEAGVVRQTPTHLEDLARLPGPDFRGLPLSRYLSPVPVLPVMLGKGCYYDRCKFCESSYINRISPRRHRPRPTEAFVADVAELSRRHGAAHFIITDEAASPSLLERAADALLGSGADGFSFEAYARFERGFTPSLCEKLARAGVRRLYMGLESADQRTLDHMHKGIRLEDVGPVLDACDAAGISYHVFGLIGMPEEPLESARRTVGFFQHPRFSAPGNGFDVAPMQIHLRSAYAAEAAELGVRFAPELAEGEFAFGLGTSWENTRGIRREQTDELLGGLLARMASDPESTAPGFLWPSVEEWGLIYERAYRGREFPFRLTLPPRGTSRRYRLRIDPAAVVERADGRVWVAGRGGQIEMRQPLFVALDDSRYRRVEEILAGIGGGESAVRRVVSTLLHAQILQLEPECEAGSPPSVLADGDGAGRVCGRGVS